jgi:NarL family two-component system sensor histidine kinase LiaS
LGPPLQAALAGEDSAERLYAVTESGEQIVLVVPVWDETHDRVLGALIAVGERPTIRTLLRDVIPILGVSLLIISLAAGLIGTVFGALAARGLVQRLDRLAEVSRIWSQGDFAPAITDSSGDEVGQLARHLNRMAEQLQNLLDTRQELAVVEERNRLARDLHDSAKQQAFAVAAQIGAARTLINHDPEAAARHIAEAEQLADALRRELSTLVLELRPAALDDRGLIAALREYVEDWSRQSNIASDVRVQGERTLPLEQEQMIFRIVQEALANVARHSEANTVEIQIVYSDDQVICTVEDNGRGFDSERLSGGFGLRSMHERAAASGGSLSVESEAGKGTSVILILPLTGERHT